MVGSVLVYLSGVGAGHLQSTEGVEEPITLANEGTAVLQRGGGIDYCLVHIAKHFDCVAFAREAHAKIV